MPPAPGRPVRPAVDVLLRIGNADLGRRDREAGARAGDAQVAGHGERDPGAVARPVHQSDGGDRQSAKRVERGPHRLAKAPDPAFFSAHRGEIGEIGPRAEGAFAGHDQQACVAEVAKQSGELGPAVMGMALRASGRASVRRATSPSWMSRNMRRCLARRAAFVAQKKAAPLRGGPAKAFRGAPRPVEARGRGRMSTRSQPRLDSSTVAQQGRARTESHGLRWLTAVLRCAVPGSAGQRSLLWDTHQRG